jgi:hypothetical protein
MGRNQEGVGAQLSGVARRIFLNDALAASRRISQNSFRDAGLPKGVELAHGSVVNLLNSARELLENWAVGLQIQRTTANRFGQFLIAAISTRGVLKNVVQARPTRI